MQVHVTFDTGFEDDKAALAAIFGGTTAKAAPKKPGKKTPKPAAAEPAAEAAAETDDASTETETAVEEVTEATKDDVVAVLTKLNEVRGMVHTKKIVTDHGAKSVGKLDEKEYVSVVNAANKLIAEAS